MWYEAEGKIICNNEVCANHYLLEFESSQVAKSSAPGQFINVACGSGNDPLLRRPISIYDVDEKKGTVLILFRVIGRGTRLLADKSIGDVLKFTGPLGNGFNIQEKKSVLVVGGGIGIAPLYLLTKKLIEKGNQVTACLGLKDQSMLSLVEGFKSLDINLKIATDDGSYGHSGFVTELAQNALQEDRLEQIFSCGPENMMKKLIDLSKAEDIPCQVSLEKTMACGVGACLGCTCKTKDESGFSYARVCTEGPVFMGKEVALDD